MLSTAWLLGSVQLLVTCAIDSDHIVDIKWLTISVAIFLVTFPATRIPYGGYS